MAIPAESSIWTVLQQQNLRGPWWTALVTGSKIIHYINLRFTLVTCQTKASST